MNVKINKAKIKKSIFLDAEYTRFNEDGTFDTISISSTQVIHDDLREAFARMNDVLAIQCDLYIEENNGRVYGK